MNNSTDNINDHPLELTFKNSQRSNRVSSSTDIQNLVVRLKLSKYIYNSN
jgi:hypothetical protein